MRVDSVQGTTQVSSSKNTKSKEKSEDFFTILSSRMNSSDKKIKSQKIEINSTNQAQMEEDETIKKMNDGVEIISGQVPTEESKMESESQIEEENPLAMLLDLSVYENRKVNVSALNEKLLKNESQPILIDGKNKIPSAKISSEEVIMNGVIPLEEEIPIVAGNMVNTKKDAVLPKDNIVPPNVVEEESLISIKESAPIVKTQGKTESVFVVELPGEEVQPEKVIKIMEKELPLLKDMEANELTEEPVSVAPKPDVNLNLKEVKSQAMDSKIVLPSTTLSNDNLQKVNDSIIKLMETTTEGDANVMKVKLYPEELGSVNVTLKMEEGKLVAKILVDNDQIKMMFTNKMSELSENLSKQNINVEKVQVDINGNSNGNQSGNPNENPNGKHQSSTQIAEFGSPSDVMVETSIADNTSVVSGAVSVLA